MKLRGNYQLILIGLLVCQTLDTFAQSSDSLFVHLYTDSLKRGNFNYINIDGKLPDGRFTPLDSSELEFRSSGGMFYGNSLYLPFQFQDTAVSILITLRRNKSVQKQLTLPIKKIVDNTPVPTEEEFYRNSRKKKRAIKKSGRLLCVFQEFSQSYVSQWML